MPTYKILSKKVSDTSKNIIAVSEGGKRRIIGDQRKRSVPYDDRRSMITYARETVYSIRWDSDALSDIFGKRIRVSYSGLGADILNMDYKRQLTGKDLAEILNKVAREQKVDVGFK
jgi:hypothetical protein